MLQWSNSRMRLPITFTLDLEDPSETYAADGRYVRTTRDILAFLDARRIHGTFFVVGQLARACPDLVREVAAAGHEVACHGDTHTPLDRLGLDRFREEIGRAKETLEDLSGKEVSGFRAPIFSLVETTTWATDVIAECGFAYSSSVLPARNPLYGFAAAPRHPFVWDNGLIELPCPVYEFGPATLPYLGGFYMRYLPKSGIDWARSRSQSAEILWTYCHPYDFDADEPFAKMRGASWLTSALLWGNRRGTFERLKWLLSESGSKPLNQRIGDLGKAQLPVWNGKHSAAA